MKKVFLSVWNHSIRDQLLFGFGAVMIALITLFTWSVAQNNQAFLTEQAMKEAQNRSTMLAANSRVWVMANDYEGLEQVVQDFKIYEDLIYAAVIDMDGKVIAHTDSELIGKYISDAPRTEYLQRILNNDQTHHQYAMTVFGQTPEYLDVAQMIHYGNQYLGWVNIRISQTARQENIQSIMDQAMIFSLISLLIAIVFAYLSSAGLTRQLHQLIETMVSIRHGNEDLRAEESGVSEVKQLSHEFNLMLESLHENEAQLKQAQEELREDIRKRADIEKEIRELNGTLEIKVAERTEELSLEKDKAEMANRAKSLFLANMSHELRTPLNAILGFSQLMQEDESLSKSLHANVDIINRSGAHLLSLINDVLDMSKIEAGRMALELEDFDLGELIRDITDMMRVRAKDKAITLLLDQTSRFPRFVHGDSAKLRQILINLLSNAVKFTHEGGVTLRLDATQKAGEEALILHVEVEDSGSGIEKQDLERIFLPFEQLANSTSQKGTGLGLAITRQFIEMMSGQIHVESDIGRGSLFAFDVVLAPAEKAVEIKAQENGMKQVIALAPDQPEWRVLIVEDQLENQLLLQKILKKVGFEVKIAENGREAVEVFQSWQPHFIWMDRRMPVMDGLTATREIRQLPGGDQVKIAALTASVFKQQKDEVLEAGSDAFLRKPYRAEEIFNCMAELLPLSYLYNEDQLAVEEEDAEFVLDANCLQAIEPILLKRLHEAALLGQVSKLQALIEGLRGSDPVLATALLKLVENYRFDVLIDLTTLTNERDG